MVEILKREDISAYKDLIDECFGSSNDLSQYEKYCEKQSYTIYVVKDRDEIAGSVTQYAVDLFTFGFQPCLMIFNVAVKPGYRGKGIAQELFRHIIEGAKAQGYRSISLTCLDDAYPAHRLYEGLGFKKAGSVKYDMHLYCE